MRRPLRRLFGLIAMALPGVAEAHLNSPHIYLEEELGPYPVVVVVEMPAAVPGEAEVQVRLQDRTPGETVSVLVREIPPQGEDHAPVWVDARVSDVDPDFYTAPLPLMVYGLWKAQVRVEGSRGEGFLEIPLTARIPRPLAMDGPLAVFLAILLVIITVALWQLLGALGRDAHRSIGATPTPSDLKRGRRAAIFGTVSFSAFVGFIFFVWWSFHTAREITGGTGLVSEVAFLGPAVAGRPVTATLEVREQRRDRPVQDVVRDHKKWMHLAIVQVPDLRYFARIHPVMESDGVFRFTFTPPEAGEYTLFGDFTLRSGEINTVTNVIEIGLGQPFTGAVFEDPDDSDCFQREIGSTSTRETSYDVGDGLLMRWNRETGESLRVLDLMRLAFELVDTDGNPVGGLEPLEGSAGHLLTVRSDLQVFTRVLPAGTLTGRASSSSPNRSTVVFPFGFPSPGLYRIWVQMKREGRVYTGVFDAAVE